MVRLFWFTQRKISKIRGTSQGKVQNPQPEYPNRKLCSIYFFLLPLGPGPMVKLVPDSLCKLECTAQVKLYMPISNELSLSGGFAYHLRKPWTNWFSQVNGKQPQLIDCSFGFTILTLYFFKLSFQMVTN